MNSAVYDIVKKIFNKRFNINLDEKDNTQLNKSLLGKEWGLEARDLLYIYFDIEREFGISISEEVIEEGNFDSVNNIISAIELNKVA